MPSTTKPPTWFWIVAVLFLLWELVGFGGFVADRMMTPDMLAQMSEYDRDLRASQPAWTVWAYGIATTTGLVGGIALLLRRRDARAFYIVSLIFVALLFGWVLGATDIIAVKGFATAAGLPIVIAALGAVEIWFAGLAIKRGWIG